MKISIICVGKVKEKYFRDAIDELSSTYEIGTYIIQECTGDDSAYRTTIMRLIIKG